MKSLINLVAWAIVLWVCVYAAARPDGGALYHHPMAAVGAMLIGLGAYAEARRRFRKGEVVKGH